MTQKKRDLSPSNIVIWLPILISLITLIISSVLTVVSLQTANSALQIANEANNISKEANDIVSGRSRLLPIIKVMKYPEEVINFTNYENIQNSSVSITLLNSGTVPIDQIGYEFIVLSGLTFSYYDPAIDFKELGRTNGAISLDSQLDAKGYLTIDIKKPLLEFLQTLNLPRKDTIYRSTISIVFLPRRIGESLPIQTPGNSNDDRVLISIEYMPLSLSAKEIDNLLQELNIPVSINNYSN